MSSHVYLDLATPDPEFPGFTVHPEDQLPGRPTEGRINITRFFESFTLFVTEAQEEHFVRGDSIYDDLREKCLPVLGPNVGKFLLQHQRFIPSKLRMNAFLVFWGKVYRNDNKRRYVRCLYWGGGRWFWHEMAIDRDSWSARERTVLLAR